MDKYTEDVIELMINKDNTLLKKILHKFSDNVPENLTKDDAIMIIEQTKKAYTEFASFEKIVESEFSCPKCDKKFVENIERQVRSADEGSTIFGKCKSCMYEWKLSA
jgi:DNA-directed RNA polymerase subunit M/transcription elongation factor TFIIS